MRRRVPRLTFLALALATASCGGGGVDEPPASFAGVWELTATNVSAATFVHCTGDLVGLEGMHLDGSRAATVTCYSDVSPVAQSGSVVTLAPVAYSCDDGDYGSTSGGGTVDAKHIDFKMITSSDYFGFVDTDKYTGTKTSVTTFILDEWQVTVTGAMTGSCNFSPRLRYSGAIVGTSRAAPERREVRGDAIPGRLVPKLLESLGKR
jgi:hypothetical protein